MLNGSSAYNFFYKFLLRGIKHIYYLFSIFVLDDPDTRTIINVIATTTISRISIILLISCRLLSILILIPINRLSTASTTTKYVV